MACIISGREQLPVKLTSIRPMFPRTAMVQIGAGFSRCSLLPRLPDFSAESRVHNWNSIFLDHSSRSSTPSKVSAHVLLIADTKIGLLPFLLLVTSIYGAGSAIVEYVSFFRTIVCRNRVYVAAKAGQGRAASDGIVFVRAQPIIIGLLLCMYVADMLYLLYSNHPARPTFSSFASISIKHTPCSPPRTQPGKIPNCINNNSGSQYVYVHFLPQLASVVLLFISIHI